MLLTQISVKAVYNQYLSTLKDNVTYALVHHSKHVLWKNAQRKLISTMQCKMYSRYLTGQLELLFVTVVPQFVYDHSWMQHEGLYIHPVIFVHVIKQ